MQKFRILLIKIRDKYNSINPFFQSNEKGDLLFDEICQLVNVELKSQQRYLKDEFLKYNNDKDDGKYFEQVLNYKEWTDKSQVGDNAGLRQDAIDDGVVATVRKSSLFVSRDTGFDGREAYDLRVYLTNVLIRAHAVNETFQSDMKSIFENEIKCGKYSRAPVKLAERCQIKASTDYGNRKWPTTSCIVDLIRCSIAFTSYVFLELIIQLTKTNIDLWFVVVLFLFFVCFIFNKQCTRNDIVNG